MGWAVHVRTQLRKRSACTCPLWIRCAPSSDSQMSDTVLNCMHHTTHAQADEHGPCHHLLRLRQKGGRVA